MARPKRPLTVTPGTILRELDASETEQYLDAWLKAYGANRHGVNAKDFLWHIFSAERYPALSGQQALAEYGKQLAPEYVVLSNDRDQAFETDALPVGCSLYDFLVFPRNLAWTMAFTHEDGWLGPYFAVHQRHAVLEEENQKRLQKSREIAAAKAKGWA
ncbi:DUF4275 family protein [Ramlibacter ginsenosidimutans]|uniref:DUF4275 family protein n=1 Tax=Ramlibacter ginsenosidimutans TaxID=502333 RepID=A0A934WL32_9BURK|nr:DUF4275 family protein [Ramlibacter ginsenosidimutans]MBK6006349.1 DUF4275 family protein [Ramlibacter ginsenosidimutans]